MLVNEIVINLVHIGHNHEIINAHFPYETVECETCQKIALYNEAKLTNFAVDITQISIILFIIVLSQIFNYFFEYNTLISLKVKFSN